MSHEPLLPPLEIAAVKVLAAYAWLERFTSVAEAIEHIAVISDQVDDPTTPLDRIEIMIEFTSGDNERCAYKEKARAIQWLRRFE